MSVVNSTKIQRAGFKPGQSGNVLGKPRGARSKHLVLLDKIGADGAADILEAVMAAAKEGDIAAASLVLSRVWPAPKERPVSFDLPALTSPADLPIAMAAIVHAMANGQLAPGEAAAVSGILEVYRKSVETVELEERIARIERNLQCRAH